jgi:predicted acyltransferase
LALFLNTLSTYHNLRIFGVLQRIGLAYALGATLCVSFRPRVLAIIAAVILLGYWALLAFNGGWDSPMTYLGTKLDLAILGDSHMYHITWGEAKTRVAFDPEGLLSAIPAVVTVVLGYLLGMLIDSTPDRRRLVLLMIPCGLSAMALGLLWHFWSFPINKSLWTSSYVLYTAGVATIILAVLIFVLDILQFRFFNKPFLILGMNSILAFALAGIVAKLTFRYKFEVAGKMTSLSSYIFKNFYKNLSLTDPRVGSMAYALTFMLVLWVILWIFYERKIFLKV